MQKQTMLWIAVVIFGFAIDIHLAAAEQPQPPDFRGTQASSDLVTFLEDSIRGLGNVEMMTYDKAAKKAIKSVMVIQKTGAPEQVDHSVFRMGFTAIVKAEGKKDETKVMLAEFTFDGDPYTQRRLKRIALAIQTKDGWIDYAGQQRFGEPQDALKPKINPAFPVAGKK